MNADQVLHVFKTFLGLAPDSDTPPVCGAVLTSAYNGRNQPKCAKCARILARVQREAARRGGRRQEAA